VPTESGFTIATSAWDGLRHWSDPTERKVIVNRGPNAVVSMSWMESGAAHPTGLIVPTPGQHLDDPIFTQFWSHSGPGSASGTSTYTCDCRPDERFFSTAGSIGTINRKYSMTS
jgi:hypothetical protein